MVDQQQEAIMMMKGTRTKRPRPLSPLALVTVDEESSPVGGGKIYSDESVADCNEDEDMAQCLILLAQGSNSNNNSAEQLVPKKTNITTNCRSSSYECKTYNKSFPSFQALAGHRASQKKPKFGLGLADPSLLSLLGDHHQARQQLHYQQSSDNERTLWLHIADNSKVSSSNNNHNKAKVHECGICGAEFSSGQALGGHMRRHRPIGGTVSTSTIPSSSPSMSLASSSPNNSNTDNQERNFLSLDLNLPAPEDDLHHHYQQLQLCLPWEC